MSSNYHPNFCSFFFFSFKVIFVFVYLSANIIFIYLLFPNFFVGEPSTFVTWLLVLLVLICVFEKSIQNLNDKKRKVLSFKRCTGMWCGRILSAHALSWCKCVSQAWWLSSRTALEYGSVLESFFCFQLKSSKTNIIMHSYSHMTQNSERIITRWQQIGFF